MLRSTALLVALISLCAAFLMFALGEDGRETLGPGPEAGPSIQQTAGEARRRRDAELVAPSPILDEEGAAHEDKGLIVRVIDADTDVAVPRARVHFGPCDKDRLRWIFTSSFHLDGWMKEAKELVTDTEGRLHLPVPAKSSVAVVLGNGRYGKVVIEAGAREVLISTSPALELSVKVIDEAGEPQGGVPVSWRLVGGAPGDLSQHDLFGAETDVDGTAVLDVPVIDDLRWLFRGVGLRGLFLPALEMAVDPALRLSAPEADRKPIELILPSHGRLNIDLVGAREEDLSAGYFAAVARVEFEGRESRHRPSMRSNGLTRELHLGRAEFELVGLGLDLELEIWSHPDCGFESMSAKRKGPVRADETVLQRFELPKAPDRALITFRAIDEMGRPIRRTACNGYIDGPQTWSGDDWVWQESDENGEVRLSLDPESIALKGNWNFRLSFRCEDAERKGEVQVVTPGDGTLDLGDVVFSAQPVVVSGLVLDPEGRPLEGATVSACDPQTRNFRSSMDYFEERVTTDLNGRFVIRGEAAKGGLLFAAVETVMVAAEYGMGFSDPIEVAVGASDLEIRMRPHARLQGRIVAAGGGDLGALGFALVPRAWGRPPRIQPKEDGAVSAWVPPGTYDFVVTRPGDDDPIVRREGLQFVSGQTHDLGEVTIAHCDRPVEIALFLDDEDERWQVSATLRRVAEDGDMKSIGRRWMQHGKYEVLYMPSLPAELEIDVQGYRLSRHIISETRSAIRLTRGFPVRIRVEGIAPSEGWPENSQFSVGIYGGAFPGFEERIGDRRFGLGEQPGLIEVRRAGHFLVSLWVMLPMNESGSSRRGFDPAGGKKFEIEVKPVETEQVFTIKADPDAIERLLEEWRKEKGE
ncbi:MAG: carboxypeptidase regulatory-like domain-containing protein [Planctomycetes bacterium]|nr:carboxypeptidase regulatory-like domain-containing protein [Planctomycetota bacterium]